jgi:hypothetical protein
MQLFVACNLDWFFVQLKIQQKLVAYATILQLLPTSSTQMDGFYFYYCTNTSLYIPIIILVTKKVAPMMP